MTEFLKSLALYCCLLTMTSICAQIHEIDADTLLPSVEPTVHKLPDNAEVLLLKYPKVYWFDSFKLPIGDVAMAKIKKGITSNTAGSNNGATVNKSKYKFSAQVKNNQDNSKAEVKGKVEILNEYIMTSGGFLDGILNIETETFGGNVSYVRKLSASIAINGNQDQIWLMNLWTNGQGSEFQLEEGFLTYGNRLIQIELNEDQVPDDLTPSGYANLDFRRYVSLSFDFIEQGKTIGRLRRNGENAIVLDPELDPETKLILMAAMVVIEK